MHCVCVFMDEIAYGHPGNEDYRDSIGLHYGTTPVDFTQLHYIKKKDIEVNCPMYSPSLCAAVADGDR